MSDNQKNSQITDGSKIIAYHQAIMQYAISLFNTTAQLLYKEKPNLFKNVNKNQAKMNEIIKIIFVSDNLDFYFSLCKTSVLPKVFLAIYNKTLWGIKTKDYCEKAIRKLYESYSKQKDKEKMLACETIINKYIDKKEIENG